MTVKKSTYLCSILLILFASSILISDVNARSASHSSHGSSLSGHHSHQSYHPTHSSGSPVTQHKYTQSHSYPTSHSSGSSGTSSHGYPSSPPHSMSGSNNNYGGSSQHSYPPSNSMSGSGSRPGYPSYPSSNSGSTSGSLYPSSHPNSLSGSSSSSNSGKSGSGHSYPVSKPNTLSGSGSRNGSSSYPSSNGLSGNSNVGTHKSTGGSSYQNSYSINSHKNTNRGSNGIVHNVHTSSHVIHHHHHYGYQYAPPTAIRYTTSNEMSPINYPVYRGTPPTYVYEYTSSQNRYSQLLAGLALYNLGRMSTTTNSHEYHARYIPQPDEYCKFGVQYKSGNFEEMNIDCRAITYFIYETQPQTQTYMTTNIMNQTTVTTQSMLPNGTLVGPANVQAQVSIGNAPMVPNIQQVLNNVGQVMPNIQQNGNFITPTTQVVSVNDPRFYGQPVKVNPEMECYVTRTTRFDNMKKTVPCALLQQYAASSLRKSSAAMMKSSLIVILIALGLSLY